MPEQSSPLPISPPGTGDEANNAGEAVAELTFESALSELEHIVSRMESGELSLEESLTAYKRGAELLQFCQAALKDAQQQVKILEGGVLQDFRSDAEQP
ncbi:MAG TPA: exodeoxyribonuclease VII small subunit [Burkholderiales bacterium]|nr:exodeoxyribonuclease VII small subunit [Burkholderiales bacterium]